MGIPVGTTTRQLDSLARWMLAGLVVVAMLAWPRPSLIGWGALTIGLLTTLLLWLMSRTVAGDRTVPGHPVHWVLLGPAAILAYHLGRENMLLSSHPFSPTGAMNVSMLFQMCLLAVGVMLSQSLLPRAAEHIGVLSVCGGAMMLAPLAAIVMNGAAVEAMRHSLALLGFAGIGVWMSALWGVGWRTEVWGDRSPPDASEARPMPTKWLRIVIIVVGAVAAAGLTWLSPQAAMFSVGVLGAGLMLGGLVFHQHRIVLLVGGVVLACGGLMVSGAVSGLARLVTQFSHNGPIGMGEAAFGRVDAASSGLSVLGWTIGWGGLCWMVGGWTLCVVWLMTHARRRRVTDRRRAVVWSTTTALSSCAILSVGGLFTPAMVVAAAFTWGLLPQMLGRPSRGRSGVVLLVVMVALGVVVGVANNRGLISWAMTATLQSGRVDKWMHIAMGMTLTMMLAWLMGARRAWLGLVGILLATTVGGLGELMQRVFGKPTDYQDVIAHLIGCGLGALPFLFCIGARWCESADVKPVSPGAADAYQADPYL